MTSENDLFINPVMEIFSNSNSNELIELLKQNNMIMDVVLHNYYFELDRDFEIPLGSLLGDKYYINKTELRKNNFQSIPQYSIDEQVNLYKRISNIFLILYKKGVFKKLEAIVDKHEDDLEAEYPSSESKYNISVNIDYKINGIRVFQIVSKNATEEEFDEYGYSDNYYLEELRKTKDFIAIQFQSWFEKLSDKSKKYIIAGDRLVELTLDIKPNGLLDFSPLLVDYFKALEVEILQLFKSNFDDIFKAAEIIRTINFDDRTLAKGELYALRDFADTIYKFKSKYDVSGTKPLYYLLKYFGLGNIIKDMVRDFKSVFPYDKLIVLEKEYLIIDRINELGKNRNTFIHSGGILEGKNSFLIIYSDIVSIMNLLSQLK